jgi:hypothetical protein
MSIESEIHTVERRFDSIITTDREGDIRLPYGIEDQIGEEIEASLVTKMEVIINLKGFTRGYGRGNTTHGKWIRKEDLIRIIREDPQWIRSGQVAKRFGL